MLKLKNHIIAIFAIAAIATTANCGGSSDAAADTTFAGTWSADGGGNTKMVAYIGNTIEINLEDGNSSYLYWKGTFPAPIDVKQGLSIVSRADTKALEASILGSLNKTKTFVYSDGELWFEFSAMGVTRTVKLTKQ